MQKILVINPNSSPAMTEEIEKTVLSCGLRGITADVVKMDASPAALESYADYAAAAAHMAAYLSAPGSKIGDYAGVLVACYGDPGLYGLKETLGVPVVGIAEASMSVAALLGYRFSIVAAVPKAQRMMRQMVDAYGFTGRLASVESMDLSIGDFMRDDAALRREFSRCAAHAAQQGADLVIYGCAGMTRLGRMDAVTSLPVIDPVAAGAHALAALIAGGFAVSHAGLFA